MLLNSVRERSGTSGTSKGLPSSLVHSVGPRATAESEAWLRVQAVSCSLGQQVLQQRPGPRRGKAGGSRGASASVPR